MADRWIVIPSWDKFQHRDAGRSRHGLIWLRDYADQLGKDEYRELTFHQRGLLRDLRHSYATTRGQLRDNTLALTRRLGQRVLTRDLEALADAGYIAFVASKPAALSAQDGQPRSRREREVERLAFTSTTDAANGQTTGKPDNELPNIDSILKEL